MTLKLAFFISVVTLLFTFNTYSQESSKIVTSFDFEDVENWRDFGNDNFKKGIDTLEARGGKSSAFIESREGARGFATIVYGIPADFVGKKIKLTGYIKTENISKGYAGLWMRIDPGVAFYNMSDKKINGTTDWQKYEIEFDYDASRAENIVIGGLLSGIGKMWIDDLEVTIDGKNINDAEKKPLLTSEIKESYVKQIKTNKKDLVDLSSDDQLEIDLQSLIASIGDKKIVAIGEDTHGTSEYYKLRGAITKKLILEKGFNMVVLENPYDDIELLVRGVQKEDMKSLMRKHVFSIYQTREMKSFLDWFKTEGITNKVKFKGCDDSYWAFSELLEEQLKTLKNDEIAGLLEPINDAATLTVKQFNKKNKKAGRKAATKDDLNIVIYETATALEEALIAEDLLSKEMEEYIFNIKTSHINYLHLANKEPIVSRDEMMARRIAYFAKDPDAKIIVWAHNAHISNVEIMDGEIGLMGEGLKEEFGDDYHSIGLSSEYGSYSYIENRFVNGDHSYDDPLLKAEINLQPQSSWGNTLSTVGENAFYFETKDLLEKEVFDNLKLMGYARETEADYYKLSPLKMFDTLFFIKTTKATQPLFN